MEPIQYFPLSLWGLIEDQSREAIEVDFANMYLGGGALVRGCVQVLFWRVFFSFSHFESNH